MSPEARAPSVWHTGLQQLKAANRRNLLTVCMQAVWYGNHWTGALLLPLSGCYRLALAGRRLLYKVGLLPEYRAAAPVIVVGNLTVGGTGKTPLVIWLARYLQSLGYKPGIISRGYGARARPAAWLRPWLALRSAHPARVRRVAPDGNPDLVGDEPTLLAQRTGCPVVVGGARAAAAAAILQQTDCDILLSDDGLQHTALARDIEIVTLDGQRRLGNGRCLPAGPLREPAQRLRGVDLIVTRGAARADEFRMDYRFLPMRTLDGREQRPLDSFRGRAVHAVAGIGNPAYFFAMLRQHGLHVRPHVFPDHHRYQPTELEFDDDLAVLMTEKDAVKCRRLKPDRAWYAPVEASLPATFEHRLKDLLEEMQSG